MPLYLEYRIHSLEQNERSCFVEISGVKKEKDENVENIVKKIADSLKIELNKSDVENFYRKPTNRIPDKPLIVVKLASKSKCYEFMMKIGKIYYKDQSIYINGSLTAFNRKLF
jgi:hypothetical protein